MVQQIKQSLVVVQMEGTTMRRLTVSRAGCSFLRYDAKCVVSRDEGHVWSFSRRFCTGHTIDLRDCEKNNAPSVPVSQNRLIMLHYDQREVQFENPWVPIC